MPSEGELAPPRRPRRTRRATVLRLNGCWSVKKPRLGASSSRKDLLRRSFYLGQGIEYFVAKAMRPRLAQGDFNLGFSSDLFLSRACRCRVLVAGARLNCKGHGTSTLRGSRKRPHDKHLQRCLLSRRDRA